MASDGSIGVVADKLIWLIYAEIGLFSLISVGCVMQLIRHQIATRKDPFSATSAGWSFRRHFHLLLCVANTARVLSLVLELLLNNADGDSQTAWWNYLAHSLPSLLFLSTYSVLILFWAQLYYAATLVSYPLLRPIFFFLNASVYCIFCVVAILTAILQAYEEFRVYSLFIVGLVHLASALGFIYYGVKVSLQLSNRKGRYTLAGRKSVLRRVLFLAILCTSIFLLRGTYDVLVATHLLHNYYPANTSRYCWDALVFFLVELLPSCVILLLTGRKAPSPSSSVDSNGDIESAHLVQSENGESMLTSRLVPGSGGVGMMPVGGHRGANGHGNGHRHAAPQLDSDGYVSLPRDSGIGYAAKAVQPHGSGYSEDAISSGEVAVADHGRSRAAHAGNVHNQPHHKLEPAVSVSPLRQAPAHTAGRHSHTRGSQRA